MQRHQHGLGFIHQLFEISLHPWADVAPATLHGVNERRRICRGILQRETRLLHAREEAHETLRCVKKATRGAATHEVVLAKSLVVIDQGNLLLRIAFALQCSPARSTRSKGLDAVWNRFMQAEALDILLQATNHHRL